MPRISRTQNATLHALGVDPSYDPWPAIDAAIDAGQKTIDDDPKPAVCTVSYTDGILDDVSPAVASQIVTRYGGRVFERIETPRGPALRLLYCR